MFIDINKNQLKPTISQMASSTDYKAKLLTEKYKSLKEKLLIILANKLKVSSGESNLAKAVHSFVKHIISTLESPTYLSQTEVNKINLIILEYPEIDLAQILSNIFEDMTTINATINNGSLSNYFDMGELLSLANWKNGDPYLTQWKKMDEFKANISTALDNAITNKEKLSIRYMKLLKDKAKTYVNQWNFKLDDFSLLKDYFATNDIWNNAYKGISIAQDIYYAISAINDNNYSPIFTSKKIDQLFEKFIDKLLDQMIKIIEKPSILNPVNSFTWDQLFDNNNKIKNGIPFDSLFPNMEDILRGHNLSLKNLSWNKYQLLNSSNNPATTLDNKAYMNGEISIKIGEKTRILHSINSEINIVVPGLKKIYDFLNASSKIAIEKEIRPQELMDILSIGDINELKMIFNSSSEVKYSVNLATVEKIFGVMLLSQADLDKIFPNNGPKLNMNDLKISLEMSILKSNDLAPWDNIKFKLDKFDIAKKKKSTSADQYDKVSLNPSIILQNQSVVQTLSIVPSAKNSIIKLPPKQKTTYVYDKSIERFAPNVEEALKNWVSNQLTSWIDSDIENKIKTYIQYNKNQTRFKFNAIQLKSISNGNDSFRIKFSVYDDWLKYKYTIVEFNYDIIDFNQFAQDVKWDLENNYNVNPSQSFVNDQILNPVDAKAIFTRKNGLQAPNDLFKVYINGISIDPAEIRYIESKINGEIRKFLKIKYAYAADDFFEDQSNIQTYSSEISVDISTTKATMEDLNKANEEIAYHIDDAVKKIKKISPYNSDINKDLYQDIINRFNSDVKDDIQNNKLLIKDFEERVKASIAEIDDKTGKLIEKVSLSNKQLEDLMAIFGNDIPKEVLEWIMANPEKTKEMLDMGIDKEDIKKMLSSKWVRDKMQETGIFNMNLVQELLSTLKKIKNNNKFAYLGVGIALGVSGLAAGGVSIATMNAAKRSRKLTNSRMKIKSSKLIIGLSTSIALLLIVASASLMFWVFITKGGI